MSTVNERLAEAREALGFNRKADFAKHVDIERSTYDRMEKGPHKPSGESLEAIALRCPRLNLNWVLTGRGPMLFPADMNNVVEASAKPTPALTSGPATVAHAQELASNGLLREIIDTQKETITDLRGMVATLKEELGKLFGNPDAAQYSRQPYGAAACAG